VPDTILIVDDEDSVRKTFREWLVGGNLGCTILDAPDAETALALANEHTVDLAILDWNLGAGNNGLQLLEDLYLFNPDVVAVMVTGYAHQATPLDALRMGVRDYLDKSHDLSSAVLLSVVRKQLERIRPSKRERALQRSLREFRDSVEKILPLVQTTAALNDPVPFTDSVRSLFRFLRRATKARDGVLVVRSYDAARQPAELLRAYDADGRAIDKPLLPFAHSLASAIHSMQEPAAIGDLAQAAAKMSVKLQPFELEAKSLLAVPLAAGGGLSVIVELFDRQGSGGPEAFGDEDRRLVAAVAEFGAVVVKQALAEKQVHGMMLEALAAALRASQDALAAQQHRTTASPLDQPPPAPVMEQLRHSLAHSVGEVVEPDHALKLAELVRVIAQRHGKEATGFCIEMLQSVDRLLKSASG
jgi:ActR/RegA family two-component response regulator